MSQQTGSTRNKVISGLRQLWTTWTSFGRAVFVVCAAFVASALMTSEAGATLPNCTVAALSALGVSGVTIASATVFGAPPPNLEYCHVLGSVASPSGNPNGDGFALDLPANWNGRFLMSGGGGFAGSVNPSNLAVLGRGFAVASTDTGHHGGDASWAITAPNVPAQGAVTDYFYLAVHNVTATAKQLITGFYDAPSISYSYFQGCSRADARLSSKPSDIPTTSMGSSRATPS